jgi:hypothetical protein
MPRGRPLHLNVAATQQSSSQPEGNPGFLVPVDTFSVSTLREQTVCTATEVGVM